MTSYDKTCIGTRKRKSDRRKRSKLALPFFLWRARTTDRMSSAEIREHEHARHSTRVLQSEALRGEMRRISLRADEGLKLFGINASSIEGVSNSVPIQKATPARDHANDTATSSDIGILLSFFSNVLGPVSIQYEYPGKGNPRLYRIGVTSRKSRASGSI